MVPHGLPTHRPNNLNCFMCLLLLLLLPIDHISISFVIYVLMLVFVLYLSPHFVCLCKWLTIFLVIVEGLPTCFCFVPQSTCLLWNGFLPFYFYFYFGYLLPLVPFYFLLGKHRLCLDIFFFSINFHYSISVTQYLLFII